MESSKINPYNVIVSFDTFENLRDQQKPQDEKFGDDESDEDDLEILCKVCQKSIKASKIAGHSTQCALQSKKGFEQQYKCMMCQTLFKHAPSPGNQPRCPTCKSTYATTNIENSVSVPITISSRDDVHVPLSESFKLLGFQSGVDWAKKFGTSLEREIGSFQDDYEREERDKEKEREKEEIEEDSHHHEPIILNNQIILFFDINLFQAEGEKLVYFLQTS